MKRKICLVAVVLLVVGCANLQTIHENPRAEYLLAQDMFSSTVRSLTELRKHGVFDEDDVEVITVLIEDGRKILDDWYSDVLAGIEPDKDNWSKVSGIVEKLTEFKGE